MRPMPPSLLELHRILFDAYGPQGWWPLLDCRGVNPTAAGVLRGYHPGDYTYPRTEGQRFEICLGAVLTQNTAWTNVEQALLRLAARRVLHRPRAIQEMEAAELEECIRPSGYFRVKARKLRELGRFYESLGGRIPEREALLAVWGIGPETADSILLYAYGRPVIVIDAYTRRILDAAGLVPADEPLEVARRYCDEQLPRDTPLRQEFHALMVEHGKRVYSRRPWIDPLLPERAGTPEAPPPQGRAGPHPGRDRRD